MSNQEIAKIFYGIADYLEMDGVAFKPFAYRKVAINLETMEEGVEEVYKKGGIKDLEEIPGVGKNIAKSIEEYLKTGKIKYYEQFKKKIPIDIEEIIAVEGVGPKRAKTLYQKLGIRNLKDLEKRARTHKIAPLFGFGEKMEKNILEGIAFLKKSKGRFLLGEILPKAKEVYEKLKNLKEVERIDIAGSLRRKKETIGDVDFLAISKNPEPIMDFFVKLPGVIKVWAKGATKASVRLKDGFDMDIRVVPKRSFGAALQYFTGSKEHNIATRKIAMDKGLKLSEYGLFRGPRMIASQTEQDVYRALGMDWIEPELRENQGEIEASLSGKLPKLIGYGDIKGDLHIHCDWDGGSNSIEELAGAAQKMGYEYLGISDHTKFLRIEHGLDEKQLIRRNKEIDKLNSKFYILNSRFRVLKGCEANILNNGLIDIEDDVLAQMDYVIAGIHSNLKMHKEKMTERMIRAMRNPNVDIISHPTGRLIKKRDEYQIDFDAVLKVAKETGTILEINSYPERLDLNDYNIRRAKEAGIKMIINTDSHRKDQMRFIEFGIAQARRGWAEKEDIINCWPLEKLLKAVDEVSPHLPLLMEKSAGAVIFRQQNGKFFYLLLHYPNRSPRAKREHWDFPKGHIEKGEKDTDTARREVREETGLEDIKIINGFQERIKYYFTATTQKTIFKTVVFYLAETKTEDVKISEEHINFKWLPYEEALKQLTFEKPKNILKKANQFLQPLYLGN